MYCARMQKFACQCLPQRLKPQTAGYMAVFLNSASLVPSLFLQVFRNIQAVSYSIYLQCQSVPFSYRAKNRIHLGLLALFFYRGILNNLVEEKL